MRFEDLRLSEPLLRAVRAEGYLNPTPIQSQAIPHVIEGRDVLGCAQTGTGKTAAFALPILQRLCERETRGGVSADLRPHSPSTHGDPRRSSAAGRPGRMGSPQRFVGAARPGTIRALVLAPTRELAQQIHDSFSTYGRHTEIRTAVVFGGVNQNPQVRALRAGVDIVVATPGRLLDLMGQGAVNFTGVEILVLDEADRMLDMGFLPDIRRILAELPPNRQSLLFSATMPSPIRTLAEDMLRNPVPVQVARVSSPAVTVSHWVYHLEQANKAALLVRLLERAPRTRALVFTRTKYGADKLTRQLVRAGVRAAALHGNKSQGARTRALNEFRSLETPVLVATDLAARGLDVEEIAQVINYDLTPDPETYVHRIGRTGRAGASGTAVSFCTAQQLEDLRSIERLLRAPLKVAAEPDLGNDAQGRPAGSRQTAARVTLASAGRNLFAGPKARRKRRGSGPRSGRNGVQRTSR